MPKYDDTVGNEFSDGYKTAISDVQKALGLEGKMTKLERAIDILSAAEKLRYDEVFRHGKISHDDLYERIIEARELIREVLEEGK